MRKLEDERLDFVLIYIPSQPRQGPLISYSTLGAYWQRALDTGGLCLPLLSRSKSSTKPWHTSRWSFCPAIMFLQEPVCSLILHVTEVAIEEDGNLAQPGYRNVAVCNAACRLMQVSPEDMD